MPTVRPLKKSSVTGLTRQAETVDLLGVAGTDYEKLGTHLSSKVGGFILHQIPDCSFKPGYFASGANEGEIEFYEIYEGATQTTINRRARVDVSYDASLNPTTEAWKIYDPTDGITVVRTITVTHTWTGVDLTKSTEVTT